MEPDAVNTQGGNNIWASVADTVSKTAGVVSDAYVSITKAKMANRAEIARLSASSSTPTPVQQSSGFTPNLLPQWLSQFTNPQAAVKSSQGEGTQFNQSSMLTWLIIALVALVGIRALSR